MKIFDSFRFFNELEILEIRFNILYDVVDYFVITESPYTTMGDSKPLYYWENRDRFSKFNDKVIHNVMEDIPSDFTAYYEKQKYHTAYKDIDPNCGMRYIDIPNRYQRDMYARNYTAFSLEKAGVEDGDMVITSDADEIINPLILENTDWFDPNNLYAAMQRAFYYDLNTHYQDDWRGSRVCTWGKMKDLSVDKLRDSMWEESHRLLDGGWHWSYFGGVERYRQKMTAGADSQQLTENESSSRVINKSDPLGRGISYHPVPIDESYPEYIQNNQEKYAEFIKPWN